MPPIVSPSIENQEKCDIVFTKFDDALKNLVNPETELLNLNKSFRKRNGQIKKVLYYPDKVHLNDDGTKVLTQQIFNKVYGIPITCYQ